MENIGNSQTKLIANLTGLQFINWLARFHYTKWSGPVHKSGQMVESWLNGLETHWMVLQAAWMAWKPVQLCQTNSPWPKQHVTQTAWKRLTEAYRQGRLTSKIQPMPARIEYWNRSTLALVGAPVWLTSKAKSNLKKNWLASRLVPRLFCTFFPAHKKTVHTSVLLPHVHKQCSTQYM